MSQPTSSIASTCQFPQAKVDQLPRYENQMRFGKKPRAGRPRRKDKRQYWVK